MSHHHAVVTVTLTQDRGSHQVAVIQPLVDLIGQQPKPSVSAEPEKLHLVVLGCYPAQRIRRGCVNQETSPGSDGSLKRLKVDFVAASNQDQRYLFRFSGTKADDGRSVWPGWSQQQSLVTGIQQATDG